MAKRTDIKKVLIIGAGPIVIGQTGEFDYAAVQAANALKELGYQTVVVNSGLSSLSTDKIVADTSYLEPLNLKRLVKIIEKERPNALLPSFGGQTALNLCSELYNAGILEQYHVELLGTGPDAIEKSEDRIAFKELLSSLLLDTLPSAPAYTLDEAEKIAEGLGYPVMVRAAYTLGGTGSGIVYNSEELKTVVSQGFRASIVGQVMVEQSVTGWQELELELLRDSKGNKIIAAFIENIDPMGIHTGDSVSCIPMLTVPKEIQKRLEQTSFKLSDALSFSGSANIQFAYDAVSGKAFVIDVNLRASRTTAFASKASGIPISKIAAQLSLGMTLDEVLGKDFAELAPAKDFVAVKFPRWDFDKYEGSKDILSTQTKAVGEAIGIGDTFKEALQKAVKGLAKGKEGIGLKKYEQLSADELLDKLRETSSERLFVIYEAIKKNVSLTDIEHLTKINGFFLKELQELTTKQNVTAGFKKIAIQGSSDKAYYYASNSSAGKAADSGKKKVLLLGSGPARIGQGTEFDFSLVHALKTFSELGLETIVIDCNPTAVSTISDFADKIYLEPLTFEAVLAVCENEKPDGVITQFGGTAALALSPELEKAGLPILGTASAAYLLTADRNSLSNTLKEMDIKMPEMAVANSAVEALSLSGKIGYPLMARPLYNTNKAKTEVVYDEGSLKELCLSGNDISIKNPLLIERFLNSAFEFEADAVSDGKTVFVPAVMEHIELAGVHSGDSALVLPSAKLTAEQTETAKRYIGLIAEAFKITGLFNIEFAFENGTIYVLEVRLGASRTIPFLAKVTRCDLSSAASKILASTITGQNFSLSLLNPVTISHCSVKEAVFPFGTLPDVDPLLGPEMRSTGAVVGLGATLEEAYSKAQEATGISLPSSGTVFISVNERDKKEVVSVASSFEASGFTILATGGTYQLLSKNGVQAKRIDKLKEGRPNIYDAIVNRQVDLIINTPTDIKSSVDDDSYIRKAAIKYNINYITTLAAAKVAVKAIQSTSSEVKAIQDYLK